MGIERSIEKKQRETGREVSQVSSIHFISYTCTYLLHSYSQQAFKDLDALIEKVSAVKEIKGLFDVRVSLNRPKIW